MKRFKLELDHLPEGGKRFEGELEAEIFQINEDGVSIMGPLKFDVNVQRFEGELFLQGKLSAPFSFQCVRCLDTFVKTIRIDDFAASMEINDQTVIDVTDLFREEIVLVFPAYPNCDDSDEEKSCNIESKHFRVDKQGQSGVNNLAPNGDSSVWDALDSLR